MVNAEGKGFRVAVFVVTGLVAGLMLADIIYFSELKSGNTLSSGEINSMLIITGIIFAITVILFIWAGIRLFVNKDSRDKWSDESAAYLSSAGGGVTVLSPEQRKAAQDQKIVEQYNAIQNKPKAQPAHTTSGHTPPPPQHAKNQPH